MSDETKQGGYDFDFEVWWGLWVGSDGDGYNMDVHKRHAFAAWRAAKQGPRQGTAQSSPDGYADIVDEAIAAYEQWGLDDDYDAQGALDKIIGRMRERRKLYGGDVLSPCTLNPNPVGSDASAPACADVRKEESAGVGISEYNRAINEGHIG